MSANGPYITGAFICEKVLREQDGAASAIRIIDRVALPAQEKEGPLPAISLIYLVMVRRGNYKGNVTAKIEIEDPLGNTKLVAEKELDLKDAPQSGANLIVDLHFAPKEDGVYWLAVTLNKEITTRTSLEALHLLTEISPSVDGAH